MVATASGRAPITIGVTRTPKHATRNLTAALAGLAGALLICPAAVGAAPANAPADRLGPVELSADQGTGTQDPVFASATTAAPCPDGFGANALLRVGPPGGPYTNLARPLLAGGYDKQPVRAEPNRSFAVALGGAPPADGEWWVVVECFSELRGQHPQRFATSITVTGGRWHLTPGGGSAAGASGAPPPATLPTPVTGAPTDSGGTGSAAGSPDDSGATEPTGAADADDPALSRTARSGPASSGVSWWWLAALVGAGALIAVVARIARTPR